MQENIHYYVVVDNNENIAYLEDCKTQYEADLMLEWYKSHKWIFNENVKLYVKSSKQFFN